MGDTFLNGYRFLGHRPWHVNLLLEFCNVGICPQVVSPACNRDQRTGSVMDKASEICGAVVPSIALVVSLATQ
jgi:hypothetical protein